MQSLRMTLRFLFFISIFLSQGAVTELFSQDQQNPERLVQFSGITISGDSLNPVPYTKVLVKNSRYGSSTDVYGFFSFVAHQKDTVLFTAIGSKPVCGSLRDTAA